LNTQTTEIPEPINSLGLLLTIADHPGRTTERLAEKMAGGRTPVNTDTIDQLVLLLRRDLRGGGVQGKLRALVDRAWEDLYVKGWPIPTGRLSMEDRGRLRVAMARHSQRLRGGE
jgi:hypothetical protein